MNTLSKHFADKFFAIGFRVAFKFFRRPTVQAVATEPDRADGQADPMSPAMSWLAAPIGPAQTWEEALAGAAQRQRAVPADPIIR